MCGQQTLSVGSSILTHVLAVQSALRSLSPSATLVILVLEVPSGMGGPLSVAGGISSQVSDEQGEAVPEVGLLVLGVEVD